MIRCMSMNNLCVLGAHVYLVPDRFDVCIYVSYLGAICECYNLHDLQVPEDDFCDLSLDHFYSP